MAGLHNWFDVNIKSKTCVLDFTNFTPMKKNDAIDYTVNEIRKYDNLYVALSGGIDSEFAAKILHERGVKFTPIILDFTLNSAEVWHAYHWCYKNNVTPVTIKIPISEVSEKFSSIAIEHDVPFITAIDFVIEDYVSKHGGHMISGGAEPFDRDSVFFDRMQNTVSDKLDVSSYDFGIDTIFPKKHPCNLQVYTPELLFSMVNDLDYRKPIQIAMCEYYEVNARPKLPYIFNVALDQKIMNNAIRINSTIQADSIVIGTKDEFIEAALNKHKIHCSFERRS